MPCYYFSIVGDVRLFDPQAVTLRNDRAARSLAQTHAQSLRALMSGEQFKVRVTNEQGRFVYEAPGHPAR